MASRISQHFQTQPHDTHVDTHLDRAVLQDALATSKTLLFFGHCSTGTGANTTARISTNGETNTPTPQPSSQHLLLNDTLGHHRVGDPPFLWPPLPTPEVENGTTPEENPYAFTIEDVFDAPVSASLVTLVACGSAEQEIRTGDEPLGLLTALLCSGANSVVGTMWPVDPRAGVAFAEGFYRRLTRLFIPLPGEDDTRGEGEKDAEGNGASGEADRKRMRRMRRMVDLAVVLQETVVELKRSRRVGFDTASVVDWGAFTLNGAWLLDVLEEGPAASP
jgi:hypothetical protein